MSAKAPPRLLVPRLEAAHLIGQSRTTIDKLIADKTLRSVKIGRSRLVLRSSLEQFVDARLAEAAERECV